MKALYRKTKEGKIKEVVIVDRKLTDMQHEIIIYGGPLDDNTKTKILNTQVKLIDDVEHQINSYVRCFNNIGYNENLDLVLKSPYNCYPDGTPIESKVTRTIDSIENLKYPVYAQIEETGTFYFNKKLYTNVNDAELRMVPALHQRLEDIFFIIRVPFIGYIKNPSESNNDHEIVVTDVMMPFTPYEERRNVLTLTGNYFVNDTKIENEEELVKYIELNKGKSVIVKQLDSVYVPSFPMENSWIISDIETDNYVILSKDDSKVNGVLCINDELETINVINSYVDYVSRIIRINKNDKQRIYSF